MRKLSIFFFGMLLCMAVCFTSYADVIIPGKPYTGPARPVTTVVEVSEEKSTSDDSITEVPDTATVPESTTASVPTTNPDNGGEASLRQRMHAVWGAVVAALLGVAAFIAQLFHKK